MRENRCLRLLDKLFFDRWRPGDETVQFARADIVQAAKDIGFEPPKNLGDAIYAFRCRIESSKIKTTAPPEKEWVILGAGRSRYEFRLVNAFRLIPRTGLSVVKLLDSTPEMIELYANSDEQALLAKVRCNRLIDVFLGVTAHSLQNHLRTFVKTIGQIEIDEVYVGTDRNGAHYIIPVQVKDGGNQSSMTKIHQAHVWIKENYPNAIATPVSVQFMKDAKIAMFALGEEDGNLVIKAERHYALVKRSELSPKEIQAYNFDSMRN